MTVKPSLIKIGRQGILARGSRIPASFFRHQMPGKRFVVLAEGDRRLMQVRASELDLIRRAYREYEATKKSRGSNGTTN
ncbi:MAG: hypothetical protein WCI20_01095 [bacterium]